MAATDAQLAVGVAAALTAAGVSVGLWRQDPLTQDELPIVLVTPLRGTAQIAGHPHRYDEVVTLRVAMWVGTDSAAAGADATLGAALEVLDETVRGTLFAAPRKWAAGCKDIRGWRYETSMASPNGARLNLARHLDIDCEIAGDYPDAHGAGDLADMVLQVWANRATLPDDPDAEQLIQIEVEE